MTNLQGGFAVGVRQSRVTSHAEPCLHTSRPEDGFHLEEVSTKLCSIFRGVTAAAMTAARPVQPVTA
jgi:hypothetical protein